jgi:hypothetical protein
MVRPFQGRHYPAAFVPGALPTAINFHTYGVNDALLSKN